MRAKDAFLREHGPRCACSAGFPQAGVGPAFRGLRDAEIAAGRRSPRGYASAP